MTDPPSAEASAHGVAWSDTELRAFFWIENGRDLALRVKRPDSAEEELLVCTWAHSVHIHLSQPQRQGGAPMTWSTDVTQREDGTLAVHFDFASTGDVTLSCNDIRRVPWSLEALAGVLGSEEPSAGASGSPQGGP